MLKNKILKAINEAVYNVLSTDIEDQDINFSTIDIDNEYSVIENLAEEFLQHPTEELLKNIEKTYKQTEKMYKAKSFDELNTLVNSVNRILAQNPDDSGKKHIYWIDMSEVLTLILSDGHEIAVHLYPESKPAVKFLKIYDKKLVSGNYNNTIYAYIGQDWKNYIKRSKWQWSAKGRGFDYSECFNTYDGTLNDFDGWKHTYRNVNIYKHGQNDFSNYPLFELVSNITDITGYQAYVPAYGQLHMLFDYNCNGIIRTVSDKLGYEILTHIGRTQLWSSTECHFTNAKSNIVKCLEPLRDQINNDIAEKCVAYFKKNEMFVIPLFMPVNTIR